MAPDSTCARAFDPLLAKALAPVGCGRLIRATYADETTSGLTTVGMVFTKADPAAMRDLAERFAAQNLAERPDLMPRPYAARGTVAADFGDTQRASWSIRVLRDVPVVVYSVSGFADGRVVTDPQPASDAIRKGETSPAAQAGLGHDAQGIADRVERRLRKATTRPHPAAGRTSDARSGSRSHAGSGPGADAASATSAAAGRRVASPLPAGGPPSSGRPGSGPSPGPGSDSGSSSCPGSGSGPGAGRGAGGGGNKGRGADAVNEAPGTGRTSEDELR
ncbi:hypothetical protein [Streptomyces albus]|uniref:hypothetical protein n=1 Tax=Streptomyces albus TaxID=1888 RepID=UPI001FAD3FBF|nr:hypothetical protein [Streptomyces albus]